MADRRGNAGLRRRPLGRLVALLAVPQLISWGTLYYAIAFLAGPIHDSTGWRTEDIFLAFTAGLLVSGFVAAPAGRLMSSFGARPALMLGSALGGLALAIIALSQSLAVFITGWVLAGAAMALTQYEAAFSALRQLVPDDFRTGAGWITVTGGLASTLFWPLTHGLTDWIGWRATVLCFAALHIVPSLLMHWRLPLRRADDACGKSNPRAGKTQNGDRSIIALLATAFSATAIVTATVSAHGHLLMETAEASPGETLLVLALIGPMQIAGRLLELLLAGRVPSSTLGLAATLLLFVSCLLFANAKHGPLALVVFAIAYGFSNGMLTVVRGGLPLELLPHRNYAISLGNIATAPLIARAVTPAFAAWIIGTFGPNFVHGLLEIAAAFASAAILGVIALRDKPLRD